MAITIKTIDKPTNVQATLQSGGSLKSNTTYYVIVTAIYGTQTFSSFNNYSYDYNTIRSDISDEISFTTTDINKTVSLNWDTVSGATYYNVYLSETSGVYNRGNRIITLSVNACSINTNSITISATTVGSNYCCDTIVNDYTYLPGKLNKGLGNFVLEISENENITVDSLCSILDSAGLSNYYYYDGVNLVLKGSIRVLSNTTGSLVFLNKSIYTIATSFRNESEVFDFRFGQYSTTTQTIGGRCQLYISTVNTYFTNMKLYGADIYAAYGNYIANTMSIGQEIPSLNENMIGCNFYGIRNTNTNWSNNNLILPAMSRAWYGVQQVNTYWDTSNTITYYPRNGTNTFIDSTLKINNITALNMVGYQGNIYSTAAKFYDTDFIGAYYNSFKDLTFSFSSYEGLTGGFEFFYSITNKVQNEDGTPIENATVKVFYNPTNELIFEKNTDIDGVADKEYLSVMRVIPTGNGTGTNFYTRNITSEYRIEISKEGYDTQTHVIDFDKKLYLISTLNPETLPIFINQELNGEVEQTSITGKFKEDELAIGLIDKIINIDVNDTDINVIINEKIINIENE